MLTKVRCKIAFLHMCIKNNQIRLNSSLFSFGYYWLWQLIGWGDYNATLIKFKATRVRPGKPPAVYRKSWNKNLPRQVKVNVFQTLVELVRLHGSQTWTLTKWLERSLYGCYTRFLRAALNISWRDKVTNEDLYWDLQGKCESED